MAVGLLMKASYSRTRSSGTEDVATTSHDFYADALTDFSTGAMDAIGDAFLAMWTYSPNNVFAPQCHLRELRFYDDYNGDGTPGEADYIKTYDLAGGNPAPMCPPQVACSVTERPTEGGRKHWGRFYLPGISVGALKSDGSLDGTYQAALASALNTMYDAWKTVDYYPIVWSRATIPGPARIAVQKIQVDDILDVIRRRRYESVTSRIVHTVE
jgi:hypothetical protein